MSQLRETIKVNSMFETREREERGGVEPGAELVLPMRPSPEWFASREVVLRFRGPAVRHQELRSPESAAAFLVKLVRDDTKEHFLAAYLDGRHRAIGHAVVSVGTATASLVHPREVFQPAVHLGAVAVILAHNHPSGDVRPSDEDRAVTKRLAEAGRVLGISVVDALVIERGGAFYSFQERNPELLSWHPYSRGDSSELSTG